MASDTFDGLRQEIEAALFVIEPQIRGMRDLTKVSLEASTIEAVSVELADRERRKVLLSNVIVALNGIEESVAALEADGYPDLPKGEVTEQIFQELQGQNADFQAAFAEFERQALAARLTINLGQPTEKP